MRVVLDANPVIGLSKGGVFHLLPQVFREIHLAEAIWDEVVVHGQRRPGHLEALDAKKAGWLHVTPVTVTPAFRSRYRIKGNDAHVVRLAATVSADRVLTDDKVVRRVVVSLGMAVSSTATIVVALRQLDMIPSCKDVLDQMLSQNFGISAALYDEALRQAGEL